ncbi:Outer membrane protein assembly factor BamB, contains PQQ-like beta-propeller repeat [Streptomyces sp. cf386]|uniref:outer membrane protein assembly factor BamB family protein n=1 Tax=Streptomyces sp. cf386 TaxID=1761904 RepID=UPI00089068B9|nr:PQQ-binding-like beta-propeller repeat protein [Streptomyces sp. cf386]SDM80373.1 Outer membrane protein assembly factor BamB, contains PQQ-like beta-propeller repeat [Streptomyces sp. cf386]
MTQPPQPGGYGAPPTPPRPPRPPVPPQPPGPYGLLQDPYDWNAGYGAPPPPTPPAGPGGGGRRAKGWSAVVVAAVVAIALIIGGGVLYANSGDGGAKDATAGADGGTGGQVEGGDGTTSQGSEKVPARTASKVLFQIPSPKAVDAGSGAVPGSWLTGKAYVKTGVAEIVGYDPDKGTKLWTIPLPGPVCTVTGHTTKDDLTAIVHEPAMPTKAKPTHGCTQVSAIDLDAGRKLWTGSVPRGKALIRFDNITISGRTVAVGGAGGGAAFDVTSGASLWTPKANDTCHDAGYGGGPKLVALRKCRSQGGLQLHIQTIDPQSGQVISAYRMADGIEHVGIVSTDPLVVAADVSAGGGDGSGVSDYFSLDNRTGRLRTRISAPSEQYAAVCDVISRIEQCSQVAVGKDRLYLPTKARAGSADSGQTNEIVAFDLTTGRRTGQRAVAGDGHVIAPLRMDDCNLLAYKRSTDAARGGQVVSIDGRTFEQTLLLQNPATQAVRDAEAGLLPESAEYLYTQGHLYISATSAAGSARPGERRYLVIAFGAGD